MDVLTLGPRARCLPLKLQACRRPSRPISRRLAASCIARAQHGPEAPSVEGSVRRANRRSLLNAGLAFAGSFGLQWMLGARAEPEVLQVSGVSPYAAWNCTGCATAVLHVGPL